MTDSPRTAAATAARRRQAEENRAAHLRERGWTCIPPDGPAGHGRLQLVVRDAGDQVARGVVAPAGTPAAALDVVRLVTGRPRALARTEQQRRELDRVEREIESYGYRTMSGWLFGVDVRGPYASVEVAWVGRDDQVAQPETRVTLTGDRG